MATRLLRGVGATCPIAAVTQVVAISPNTATANRAFFISDPPSGNSGKRHPRRAALPLCPARLNASLPLVNPTNGLVEGGSTKVGSLALRVPILRLTGNHYAAKLKWYGKASGWHPLWRTQRRA